MKHIFVVNPGAGKNDNYTMIASGLEQYKDKLDYEIYCTSAPRDATAFIREKCENNPDELLRFYACGGDGTLNECANGVVGHKNASLACFPCGSGNDFVKYYGGKKAFYPLDALLEGTETPIDLLQVGDRYAINAVHFGFDSRVAKVMTNVRRKPFIGGNNAYATGVANALVTAMKNQCSVYADGELLNPNGVLLLATLANGQYVGGSFRCAPRSFDDDGFAEVCLVKPVSVFTFLKFMPCYTVGSHLDEPAMQKFIVYRRAKEIRLVAPKGMDVSLDGELINITDAIVRVVHHAIKFVVPKDAVRLTGALV